MMSEDAERHSFRINIPDDFQHGPLPIPILYTSSILCLYNSLQATLVIIETREMTHWLLLSFRNELQCNVSVKNGSIPWSRL